MRKREKIAIACQGKQVSAREQLKHFIHNFNDLYLSRGMHFALTEGTPSYL
jgi:hypothetical protein